MTDDESEEIGREMPGRVRALDAVIRLALDAAEDDRKRYWGSDVETSDVVKTAGGDVSDRTALRACKDAAALGWVTDERQGWDAGPRAERYVSGDVDSETVTICTDCDAVWSGHTTYCSDCGAEAIRQAEPRPPDGE